MRFNILNASRLGPDNAPFGGDYIFAWDNGVYPFNARVDYHKPFGSQFSVGKDAMNELAELLDKRWLDNNPMTFYELEDHFGGKHGMKDGWDRSRLINACRYFHLKGMFKGHDFWETMLKPMEHPTEASEITNPLQAYDYSLE